jgi:hypothetical protein
VNRRSDDSEFRISLLPTHNSTSTFTVGLLYGTIMQSSPQLRSLGSSLRNYVDSREARTGSCPRALKLRIAVPMYSEFMPRERAVCAIKHVGREKQVVAHGGRALAARDARLIPDRSNYTRRTNDHRHYHMQHTTSTWFDHS